MCVLHTTEVDALKGKKHARLNLSTTWLGLFASNAT